MKFTFHFSLVTLMLIGFKFTDCSNLTQVEALYTDLFENYNRKLFPLIDHNTTVYIGVDVGIVNINNFDELSGELVLGLIFYIRWIDERLKWEPSHYGGKSTFLLPPEDIWHPQIYSVESFDRVQEITNTSVLFRLFFNGDIVWQFGKVLKLVCTVDVTYFPFDSQTCVVTISGWAYIRNEAMFYTTNSVVRTDFYTENSQWQLQSAESQNYTMAFDDLPPSIRIAFTFKRINDFFVVYIIIPVIFLGSLNNLVFIMPASSGERTSVAITTFLSFIVFMEMVNDNVPESSSPMAFIYYYLLFLMIYSSAILFLCIFSLRIYDKGEDVPEGIKKFITVLRFWELLRRKRLNSTLTPKNASVLSKESHSDLKTDHALDAERIPTGLPALCWKLVGKTFDFYCFLVLSLVFWLMTVVSMIVYSPCRLCDISPGERAKTPDNRICRYKRTRVPDPISFTNRPFGSFTSPVYSSNTRETTSGFLTSSCLEGWETLESVSENLM